MTRYTLSIPEEFKMIVPSAVRELDGKTVEIAEDNELCTVINKPGEEREFHHVKRKWLTEIKEEPVDVVEAWERFESSYKNLPGSESMFMNGFQAGEQNNELRHRETFSYREWCLENSIFYDEKLESPSALAWQACKESHNLT